MPNDPAGELWVRADLVTPMSIRVAATLGIADELAAGPVAAGALAARVDAHPGVLERLMRHLVAAGVFAVDDEGRFLLTPLGAALRRDHPARLHRLLDIDAPLGRGELSFVQLLHSVRTGEAAFPVLYGRNFWADLVADPDRTVAYDGAMAADVAAWAPPIIAAYDWGALEHVVDVGGGNGMLLAALLDAFPALRGTVFDQPATAAAARARFSAAGLGARADAVGGDFFQSVPAGADGYLLCAIVHDWNDDEALAILRQCRVAAGTARVFVVEKIGFDGARPGTSMDLRLLVNLAGHERSRTELVALTERAGLRLTGAHDAGAIVILELVPS